MADKVTFYAEFIGRPGDTRDLAAASIVDMYAGAIVGAGTLLPTGMRDLEIECLAINAKPLKEALVKAGLTICDET